MTRRHVISDSRSTTRRDARGSTPRTANYDEPVDKEKQALIRDFAAKRDTYHASAYLSDDPAYYLRRLRNDLIRQYTEDGAENPRVLDAGCGPALLYPWLTDRAAEYHAVDLAPSNLEAIRREHAHRANLITTQSDLDNYSPPPSRFDVVICSGSLEYTRAPLANLEKLIDGVRPQGLLVASLANAASPWRLWSEHVFRHLWYVRERLAGRPANRYGRRLVRAPAVLRHARARAGVKSAEIVPFGRKLLIQPFDGWLPNLDLRVTRFLERNSPRWLDWTAVEFLVVVRK